MRQYTHLWAWLTNDPSTCEPILHVGVTKLERCAAPTIYNHDGNRHLSRSIDTRTACTHNMYEVRILATYRAVSTPMKVYHGILANLIQVYDP